MQIALCEHQRSTIAQLEAALAQRHIDTDTYENADALIRAYQKHTPCIYDALFIAVDMPGKNGLQIAHAIRAIDPKIPILFLAPNTQLLQESIKLSPFRYLLKPLQADALREAIHALVKALETDRQTYVFKDSKKIIRLYYDDIIYCESNGHYVTLHTTDTSYTIRQSINDLAQAIQSDSFYRIHRSYLLNLKHLKLVQDNKITLQKNQAILPIGRGYKKGLVATILALQTRKKF